MKIKITMTSGKKIYLINDRCKSFEEWIETNFLGDGVWFKPSGDSTILLRFENMESVEEVKKND